MDEATSTTGFPDSPADSTAQSDPESYHSESGQPPTHKWLVSIAVMVGATLEVLDSSIVNVSLPHMQGSFSAGIDEVTWILTSYLVASGIMIPLTGWIAARFGRKRYFMISVTLFIIASGLCGAAGTLAEMVIFRLIQGAAGAAMIPLSQAILMETFPPEEHGLAMATWGVGLMVAPVLGPTLGGWITDNWNWRWSFYINLPSGIVAALMAWAFIHDPPYLKKAATDRIDYLGIFYLVIGLGLLQIVLDRGQRADWFATTWVTVFTAVAVLALVLLVIHELRIPHPILDLSILKIVNFDVSVSILLVIIVIIYGTNLLNPLFFQELLGYSAWKSGLVVMPRGLGSLVAMLLVGQLSRHRFDTRWLVGVGFVMMGWSLWIMGTWNLDVSLYTAMFAITLSGVGSGLIFPTMSAATLACVERERMGYAASLYNMVRNTGAAVGISLVSNLLNSQQQVHQSNLVGHFTVFEAWKYDQLSPRMPGAPPNHFIQGLATGQNQGMAGIYHLIQRQAALMTYNDIYRALAFLAILSAPAILLVRKFTSTGEPTH